MSEFCCVRLSLVTKIIGTFGLSMSILMINVVVSEFFPRKSDKQFMTSMENWTVLGTNWINILKKAHMLNEASAVLACILSFAFLILFVNALLVLGTNIRNTTCYLPWMYMDLFVIFDQIVALTLHLSHLVYCDIYLRSPWYMRVSTAYLILCICFWTMVCMNKNEAKRRTASLLTSTDARSTIVAIADDSNVPKSPSFVSTITHSPFIYVIKSESTPDLPPAYSTVVQQPKT